MSKRQLVYPWVSRRAQRVLHARQQAVPILELCALIGLDAPDAPGLLPKILDGRFRVHNEVVDLWAWHNPFPPNGETICVMDIEATGGHIEQDELLEVAIVRVSPNGEDHFSSLVQPGRPIPPFISKLTGITQDMVKDAPSPNVVLKQALDFLAGSVLVLHDARGDLAFLGPRLGRLRRKLNCQVVDTLSLAKRALPGRRKRGLDALAQVFDAPQESRHRALGDARITLHVARELYHTLSRGEALAFSSFSEPEPTKDNTEKVAS